MNVYFKLISIGATVASLYFPAAAFAQRSGGGVVGDARLHPGTWNSRGTSSSMMRSQTTYRSAAPQSVDSGSSPAAVAQNPTEQRSFSYEPKEETKPSSSGSCGCGSSGNVQTKPTPSSTATSTESGRSYSYEPSTTSSSSEVKTTQPTQRSYSAPRSRTGGGSSFSVDRAMRAKGY